MKKPPSKKQTKTFKLTRKTIVAIVLIAVVVLIIGVIVVDQFRHYRDKQKFMILKQDMLALQAEFNKIDKGWDYIDGCNANGAKYQQNVASYCYLTLESKADISDKKYIELIARQGVFKVKNAPTTLDYSYSLDAQYQAQSSVRCTMGYHNMKHYFECSDSALDFYFPKSQ